MTIRMRHTRSHTANRRSHHAIKKGAFTVCEKCNSPRENHRACPNCGVYNGKSVLNTEKKLAKKVKSTQKAVESK